MVERHILLKHDHHVLDWRRRGCRRLCQREFAVQQHRNRSKQQRSRRERTSHGESPFRELASSIPNSESPRSQKKTEKEIDRKSTRLNSSHIPLSRLPSSA